MTTLAKVDVWLGKNGLTLELRSAKKRYYAFLKEAGVLGAIAAGTGDSVEEAVSRAMATYDEALARLGSEADS